VGVLEEICSEISPSWSTSVVSLTIRTTNLLRTFKLLKTDIFNKGNDNKCIYFFNVGLLIEILHIIGLHCFQVLKQIIFSLFFITYNINNICRELTVRSTGNITIV